MAVRSLCGSLQGERGIPVAGGPTEVSLGGEEGPSVGWVPWGSPWGGVEVPGLVALWGCRVVPGACGGGFGGAGAMGVPKQMTGGVQGPYEGPRAGGPMWMRGVPGTRSSRGGGGGEGLLAVGSLWNPWKGKGGSQWQGALGGPQ